MRLEQKNLTRRNLIDATLKLSAEKGFASLSLREVTKAAGISPAAFYRHFHDMDELGLVLIDEVGLGLRQLLREAGKAGSMRASVEAFIHYVSENSNLFRVLQGEKQGSSQAFRKALFTEIGRFTEQVAENLQNDPSLKSVKIEDLGLAAEAMVAVAFTVGGEVLDLPKHRRGEIIERLVKQLRLIIKGLRVGLVPAKKRKNS